LKYFVVLLHALPALFLFSLCGVVSFTIQNPPSSSKASVSPKEGVAQSHDSFIQVGEELSYKVKYWFIGLGEIRVRVTDVVQKDGEKLYRAEAYIDSYSGNPLVNLHHYYQTEFDTALNSRYFYGRWLEDDVWKYVKYFFEYHRNVVLIEKGTENPHVLEGYDTTEINRRFQDGLSLLFFARGYVSSSQKMVIPTFINEEKKRTFFDFTNKATDEEIDSVSYPIDVVEFSGAADWVGIFGLTGSFRGWFSNDAARIPIVARMKVIIGNVKVTLESWRRVGWSPPEYKEPG